MFNMFRPMRRKNKEISESQLESLLHNERRGVLAVNGEGGYPYALPVNYLYDGQNGKIYFHGSRVGHKAEAIAACDKVCFTVFGNETVRDEPWAPFLQSAVIFGRCRIVGDRAAAAALIKQFAMKYYPDENLADEEIARSGGAVQMYEIEIEHITGKQIQEK